MELSDLERTCPECAGATRIQHPAWIEFWKTRPANSNPTAPGTDYWDGEPNVPEEIPCPDCEGRGVMPTALGAQILGFVRRHLEISRLESTVQAHDRAAREFSAQLNGMTYP